MLKLKYLSISGLYDVDVISGWTLWITISILGQNVTISIYDSLNCTFNDHALRSFAYMAQNFVDGSVLSVIRKKVQHQRWGMIVGRWLLLLLIPSAQVVIQQKLDIRRKV